jgi:hypothetical protein
VEAVCAAIAPPGMCGALVSWAVAHQSGESRAGEHGIKHGVSLQEGDRCGSMKTDKVLRSKTRRGKMKLGRVGKRIRYFYRDGNDLCAILLAVCGADTGCVRLYEL